MMRLPEKLSYLLQEVGIYLDPTVLTICTVPYNMMQDENGMNMKERVRHFNEVIREAQKKSVLPLRLLYVAWMKENYLPDGCSSDGIHFDRAKGVEWLNNVFQKHINCLESVLLEAGQFTFGPTRGLLSSQSGQWKTGWEIGLILETFRRVAGSDSRAKHPWRRT